MPDTERLQLLFDRYIARECTPQEVEEFVVLLQDAGASGSLTPQMETLWNRIREEAKQYPVDWQRIYDTVVRTGDLTGSTRIPREEMRTGLPRIRRMINPIRAVAAAAAVMLLLGAGAYFLFFNKSSKRIVEAGKQEQRYNNDVPPGGNRAVLTLSNGTTIILDSTRNGMLARQGNTKILKLNSGELTYSQPATGNPSSATIQYNTLSTPRGGQYHVVLPDGTGVWLNAASSIRYPTVVTGKEREVEITGEAYFEVAENAAMPFIVKKGNVEVKVLGTHFNVNAYDDEGNMKVTLLEGSVKVEQRTTDNGQRTTGNQQLLTPGQQAQAEPDGRIRLIRNADVEQAVAWKNGEFSFRHNDIYEIMRQLSRWYNVDVSYKDSLDLHLSGQISKNVNASAVFRMLEFAGNVQFQIVGRKIIVMK